MSKYPCLLIRWSGPGQDAAHERPEAAPGDAVTEALPMVLQVGEAAVAVAGAELEAKRARRREISRAYRARKSARREAERPVPERDPVMAAPGQRICALSGCNRPVARRTAAYCGTACRNASLKAQTHAQRARPPAAWPAPIKALQDRLAALEGERETADRDRPPVIRRELLSTAARLDQAKRNLMAASPS
jgi:hypothetical protein